MQINVHIVDDSRTGLRVNHSKVAEQLAQLPEQIRAEAFTWLLGTMELKLERETGKDPYFCGHYLLHDLVNRGILSAQIQLHEVR